MKERPILFSAPMVQALLEGRKTQTRRIVKPQPHEKAGVIFTIPRPNAKGTCAHFGNIDEAGVHSNESTAYCPHGMPGEKLWVRETWAARPDYDGLPPSQCGDEAIWWKASISTLPQGYEACF